MYGLNGVHITQGSRTGYGAWLAACAAADVPVLVFAVDEGGALVEAKQYNQKNITVFRTTKYGEPYLGETAQSYMGKVMQEWALNPADYYSLFCEVNPTWEYLPWFNEITKGCIDIANQHGYKLVIQNWSVGTPSDDGGHTAEERYATQYQAWYQAMQGGHKLGLHEYGLGGLLKNEATYHALRYRRVLEWCKANGLKDLDIVITEAGQFGGMEFHGAELMMEDISWYTEEVRKDQDVLGFAWWTLGDWGGANIQSALPQYSEYIVSHPPPDEDPPVWPPPQTIDLVEYMFGQPGVRHVLQCDIGDFHGTENHQSKTVQNPNHNIVMRQKGNNAEYWYYNRQFVGIFADTSPVQEGDIRKYYTQNTVVPGGSILGALWVKRTVSVGDAIPRSPLVRWHRYDNCSKINETVVADMLKVVTWHEKYISPDGFVYNQPCVVLAWCIGGRFEEVYTFAKGLGLVEWVHMSTGWRSYLCEVKYNEPDLPDPEKPTCFPDLSTVTLYEPVDPQPVERARGIDISKWQGVPDMQKVAAAGYDFVIIRASVGDYYIDERFAYNWDETLKYGMVPMAYHVNVPVCDPIKQRDKFFEALGGREMYTRAWLDCELFDDPRLPYDGPLPAEVITENIIGCYDAFESAHMLPGTYTAVWFWNRRTLPGTGRGDLWVADWQSTIQPLLPRDWTSWRIWQTTSRGSVPGIIGNVDLNVFNGTPQEFMDWVDHFAPPVEGYARVIGATWLNARTVPTTEFGDNTIVTAAKLGSIVKLTGKVSGDWLEVVLLEGEQWYNGSVRVWMHGRYLELL